MINKPTSFERILFIRTYLKVNFSKPYPQTIYYRNDKFFDKHVFLEDLIKKVDFELKPTTTTKIILF